MRVVGFSVLLLTLAGCLGTPQLPTLNEVELAEDSASSGLVASPNPASKTVLEELQSVENLPEVPDQPTGDKPRRGLFGLFARNKPDAASGDTTVATQKADAGAEVTETPAKPDATLTEDTVAQTPNPKASDPPRRGLFGLFGGKRNSATPETPDGAVVSDAKPAVDQDEDVIASLAPEEPRQPRRGLFGPRRNRGSEPIVAPGTVLPFGEIGVACGVRGRALGKEVDRFPAKGRGYRLYDSNPSSTTPRTHYLTGFKDGCPRQFTAALAMIGSPVLHEQMRYDQYNKDLPFTDADKAYERIKRRICKVAKGQLCPEERVRALEKGMAFVTLYERFGGNASWEEVLLHEGKIAGSSLRKR